MKLVILFGPQAVGKMTVGEALAERTGLRLFHNHMTIELVTHFFNYGTPQGKYLVGKFREEIFEQVAASDLPGLIFTFVWAFDQREDWDYIAHVRELFERRGAQVYLVELEATLQARLERNRTPHRLAEKPTKRNLDFSERDLLESLERYRLNSLPGELEGPNYLRLDNTRLSPEQAAARICEAFGWT